MSNENSDGDLGDKKRLSRDDLSPEQKRRLEIVIERLFPCGGTNANVADTSDHALEHGFMFKRESPFQTK